MDADRGAPLALAAGRSTRALGSKMTTSFVNATLQAAPVMNKGGGIVIGTVSALVENFVHERAPWHSPRPASLSRRLPPRRLHRVRACVESAPFRVGHAKRGSTSESPDGSELGQTPGMRALVVPGRSHAVRPNYAFERTVKSPRNHRGLRAAAQRER
jgi:hypothetical protein